MKVYNGTEVAEQVKTAAFALKSSLMQDLVLSELSVKNWVMRTHFLTLQRISIQIFNLTLLNHISSIL